MKYFLQCVGCEKKYSGSEIRYRCDCGEILEVKITKKIERTSLKQRFDERLHSFELPLRSGVWRYKELILPIDDKYIVTKPEGNTNLYPVGTECGDGLSAIGKYVGNSYMYIKHEGENPTGSFKDRGMTAGITQAKYLNAKAVACASTGNTSASLASYAAKANMKAYVFIPDGKLAFGKLSQSIAYGAKTIQIQGDFDIAMKLVQEVCNEMNIYLLNSINPFRIQGQQSIAIEIMHQLQWNAPDWIILPAGNLGNTSAIGKALFEMKELGLINKLPRVAAIQAEGANPFYQSFKTGFKKRFAVQAQTIATAILIGNPVSYTKARKVIEQTNGVVEQVTDNEILDAKAVVDAAGIGCEPGSATAIAGAKKLVTTGIIKRNDSIVCITTGHVLKDADTIMKYHNKEFPNIVPKFSNQIIPVDASIEAVKRILK